jgi:hypothetical protein
MGDKMNNENGTGQILIKTCPEVIQNSVMLLAPSYFFLHCSFIYIKSYSIAYKLHLVLKAMSLAFLFFILMHSTNFGSIVNVA